MKQLLYLHLSDLHLPGGSSDQYQVHRVLDALIETLEEEADKGQEPDLIFITGDLADKGRDYTKVERLLDDLLSASGLKRRLGHSARRRLFVVPGNHDVDRDKSSGEQFLRRTLADRTQSDSFFAPKAGAKRKPYFERFRAYQEFFNHYFGGIREFNEENHYYAELLDVDEVPIRLGVVGLNSAWFSEDDEDNGKLWIGERVCDEAFNYLYDMGGADLIIVLYHHPLACLHNGDSHIKGLLSSKADICLYGHNHVDETELARDQHGDVLRFQAGAAYDNGEHAHQGTATTKGCVRR